MISVTGLYKAFRIQGREVPAVRNLSFQVEKGQCYALLGPSGCGKTTSLRCLAGFEKPDRGVIVLDGRTVFDAQAGVFIPPHQRSIGMVFQSYAVWPHMTVFENVAYPLQVARPRPVSKEIEARVMDVLKSLRMDAMADRPATTLSGGQQQRVAFARAVVRRPTVLLLDEPLASLDARLREDTRKELAEFVDRAQITTIYVTHDQAEAFAFADRMALMSQGEIVQEGPPRELYERPGTAFTAEFLGHANLLDGRILEAGPNYAVIRLAHADATLTVPGRHAVGTVVQVVVRPEDVQILRDRPADDAQSLCGEVEAVNFQGAHVEIVLAFGQLKIRAAVHASTELQRGARVWFRFDAERGTVFPKELEISPG